MAQIREDHGNSPFGVGNALNGITVMRGNAVKLAQTA